jgi:hypothetical protein
MPPTLRFPFFYRKGSEVLDILSQFPSLLVYSYHRTLVESFDKLLSLGLNPTNLLPVPAVKNTF